MIGAPLPQTAHAALAALLAAVGACAGEPWAAAVSLDPRAVNAAVAMGELPVVIRWHPASSARIARRLKLLRTLGVPAVVLIDRDCLATFRDEAEHV